MGGHNRWLDWKLKHGLAKRGRAVGGVMSPRGLVAGLLYRLYFRKRDVIVEIPKNTLFTQDVGGELGMTGSTNGD